MSSWKILDKNVLEEVQVICNVRSMHSTNEVLRTDGLQICPVMKFPEKHVAVKHNEGL